MRSPAWVRGETRPEEVVSEVLREDVAARKLHAGGVAKLPLDPERAHVELSEEQRAGRATRPPNGRRWKQLTRLDEDVDRATQRHTNALGALQEAEQRLQQAPDADASSLADWLAAGERGERPASTMYELERGRDATRLLVDAAAIELDRALERRLAHVERHREKMLKDALSDVETARGRLLEHARQLPVLRETLLAARETLTWAASYPDQAQAYGFQTATALGLREPVERTLGTRARVEYVSLLAALEADANALASAFSADVARRLGTAPAATPLTEAMWNDDERAVAWRKQELERARRLAEWGNAEKIAHEASDFRPDPAA